MGESTRAMDGETNTSFLKESQSSGPTQSDILGLVLFGALAFYLAYGQIRDISSKPSTNAWVLVVVSAILAFGTGIVIGRFSRRDSNKRTSPWIWVAIAGGVIASSVVGSFSDWYQAIALIMGGAIFNGIALGGTIARRNALSGR